MTVIRIVKPNPDGLDPVFTAYNMLREYFEAATIHEEHDDEHGYMGSWIVLPGLDKPFAYPDDDVNPLIELEEWLAEMVGSQLDGPPPEEMDE